MNGNCGTHFASICASLVFTQGDGVGRAAKPGIALPAPPPWTAERVMRRALAAVSGWRRWVGGDVSGNFRAILAPGMADSEAGAMNVEKTVEKMTTDVSKRSYRWTIHGHRATCELNNEGPESKTNGA